MNKHSFRSDSLGVYCSFSNGQSMCRLERHASTHQTPIVDDDYTPPIEGSSTTTVATRVRHFLRDGFDNQSQVEVIAVGGITMALNELAEAVDVLSSLHD